MTSLIVSAGLASLAVLTRYAGVALILAAFAAVLHLSERPWRKRLIELVVFGAVSCGPAALWFLRNIRSAGAATDRPLVLHPPPISQLGSALATFSTWLPLGKIHLYYRIALFFIELLLLVGIIIYLSRKRRAFSQKQLNADIRQ